MVTITSQPQGELHVFGHYCDSSGVDRTDVDIAKELG